jgi:hypothetical protein
MRVVRLAEEEAQLPHIDRSRDWESIRSRFGGSLAALCRPAIHMVWAAGYAGWGGSLAALCRPAIHMGWAAGYAVVHPAYPVGPPLIRHELVF